MVFVELSYFVIEYRFMKMIDDRVNLINETVIAYLEQTLDFFCIFTKKSIERTSCIKVQ